MDARLYRAALMGNVDSLIELLRVDGNILDQIQANDGIDRTPLHTAARLGYVEFARKILGRKPQLASKPNANGSLPLHLAAARGHAEIVRELLHIRDPLQVDAAGMCLALDKQGQTPLHVAGASGRAEVLEKLLLANPAAMLIPTLGGDSVLHVCAKRNHLGALKRLVESKDGANLVNMKDFEDNTVLHVAAAKKNVEVVKYLVNEAKVDVHAKNISGKTALDIVTKSPRDKAYWQLRSILEGAEGKEILVKRCLNLWQRRERVDGNWIERSKEVLIVIAILIATVTFQAGLNPPGGFWQDMSLNETALSLNETSLSLNKTALLVNKTALSEAHKHFLSVKEYHIAGEAIWSYLYPDQYKTFILFNSIGFLGSFLTILLLMTGLAGQGKVLMRILTGIMWGAAATMVVTYACAVYYITSRKILANAGWFDVDRVVGVWLSIVSLLFVGYLVQFTKRHLHLFSKTGTHQSSCGGESGCFARFTKCLLHLLSKTGTHRSSGGGESTTNV